MFYHALPNTHANATLLAKEPFGLLFTDTLATDFAKPSLIALQVLRAERDTPKRGCGVSLLIRCVAPSLFYF